MVLIDLLRQTVPIALDAVESQPKLRAQNRIDRHQRRMREPLIQILDDDTRVVQHQIPVHQRRQAVVGIEIEQVLRIAPGDHIDDVDLDAFFLRERCECGGYAVLRAPRTAS